MALSGRVLRVWLRVVEARLRACSPGAPASARFGAVSFIQRFGSSLNAHTHLHVCAIDGVFSQEPDGTLRFHRASALSECNIATVEATIRIRVLRLFEREGLLWGAPSSKCALGSTRAASRSTRVCASARATAQPSSASSDTAPGPQWPAGA